MKTLSGYSWSNDLFWSVFYGLVGLSWLILIASNWMIIIILNLISYVLC